MNQHAVVYSALNAKAKAWWHHQDLRRAGKAKEARERERESIRNSLRTLRQAVLFTVGEGGFTVHCAAQRTPNGVTTSRLSGYCDGSEYSAPLRCVRPEVPQVNTRDMEFAAKIPLSRAPLPATDREDPPKDDGTYGGWSYTPIPVYLAIYEGMGATVHWGKYEAERDDAYQKAAPTLAKLRANQS